MRIGITCYPTQGGSGVIATELGKLMAERGHDVHFITYDMPFRLNQFDQNIYYHEVVANRYEVFKYPPYDIALATRMAQVAKAYNLDLLHVHYAIPHAIAAMLAKQMIDKDLAVVTTLHGTDITVLGADSSLHDAICLALRKSDVITAVSNSLVGQTYDLFNINKKIEQIYNFVDHRTYFPRDVADLRKKFIDADEKVLLHISNFRQVKRTEDVIRIFKRVLKKKTDSLVLSRRRTRITKSLSDGSAM